MANAKIISIIDHEVAAALRLTAADLARLGQEGYDRQEAAHDKTQHDIAFVAANLRHDINTLAAALNQLRADLDTVAVAVNQLLDDVTN